MNIDEYLNSVNSMKGVFGNLVIICHCVWQKSRPIFLIKETHEIDIIFYNSVSSDSLFLLIVITINQEE